MRKKREVERERRGKKEEREEGSRKRVKRARGNTIQASATLGHGGLEIGRYFSCYAFMGLSGFTGGTSISAYLLITTSIGRISPPSKENASRDPLN